jgi:hypothetical protein
MIAAIRQIKFTRNPGDPSRHSTLSRSHLDLSGVYLGASILLGDPAIVPVGGLVPLWVLPLRELDLFRGHFFPRHYIEQVR